jgi:hypothetical protein
MISDRTILFLGVSQVTETLGSDVPVATPCLARASPLL